MVGTRAALKRPSGYGPAGDKVYADIDAGLVNAKARVALAPLSKSNRQKWFCTHEHNSYQAAPITLGVQDDSLAEVLAGLVGGEDYGAKQLSAESRSGQI